MIRIVRQFTLVNCDSIQLLSTKLQNCAGLCVLNYSSQPVIGVYPKWQLVALAATNTLLRTRLGLQQQCITLTENFFDALKQQSSMHAESQPHDQTVSALSTQTIRTGDKVFNGGLMGFIGYDLAASQMIALQQVESPTALMGEYDIFFKQEVSQLGDTYWQLYGPDLPELHEIYVYLRELTSDCAASRNTIKPITLKLEQAFQPVWQFAQYQQAFDKIQHYLKQGDCYQVNLTQPFEARMTGSLIATIDPLMRLTKANYGGFMKYGEFELLSCSPELFIEFNVSGELVTKPIKGTRPRHPDAEIDAALKQQLIDSEKDRSENLMIVDLLRNDLGVYAQTGSVSVPALFKVESFAQVHHLVSEIRATLKPDASPLDVLFSALPGGSITGAPKIRAMQIIDELEAQSRGAYCGSMGFLNYDGTGCFNILIRSLQKRGNTLTAWAGGGITIASNCEDEYQECLDKIGAILNCVNDLGADCHAQDN
ncbi:MAG: aminodeoxychorismate synthase component I [Moraxellaceae bacterium]|nr:MAG: aminodeoxychorismate synthase component I [Moraxellaceae bacterium]